MSHPNLAKVIAQLPEQFRVLAELYIGQLSQEQLDQLDAVLPDVETAFETGDMERVGAITSGLGLGDMTPVILAFAQQFGVVAGS